MARKLVINCDPGIDSALALSLALFSPEVEITAVTVLIDELSNAATRVGAFLRQITPFLYRRYHAQLGLEYVYLDAVIGTIAVLHPSLFRTQHWPVEIETSGEITLGQTVFDRRNGSVVNFGGNRSRYTRGLPTHRQRLIAGCQLEHKPNPYLAGISDGLNLIRLIPHLDSDRHRLAITHHLNFNAFTERR